MNRVRKILLSHSASIAAFIVGAALISLAGIYQAPHSSSIPRVHASGGTITGMAWSDNIGWICFYDATNCPNSNVAVNNDGSLTGYAWSDNIGWINFGANSCGAQATMANGALTGWAQAVANGGGWDGCIKLADTAAPSYGPTLSGSDFSGWAWGSDTVGWISFNCNAGGPTLGAPRTVSVTSGSSWSVPSDWTSPNSVIAVIGGGGGGTRGPGGGGGAYSSISPFNTTPGSSIPIAIGAGGNGAPSGSGGAGGDTWFNSSATVLAKGGAGTVDLRTSGGAGGAAGSGVGTVRFSGGTGAGATVSAACGSQGAFSGGGGGGAAGAHGNGSNGSTGAGNAPSGGTANGGAGGSGDAGSGGAGGAPNGGAGGSTTSGGGGGGAGGYADYGAVGHAGNGGNGGNYGAGGGGGGQECGAGLDGRGGSGVQGVIVVTYTPTISPNICATIPYKVSYTGPTTAPTCTLSVAPNPAATNSSITLNYTTTGTPTLGTIKDPSNNTITTTATNSSGGVAATSPSAVGTYNYTMTVSNPAGTGTCNTNSAPLVTKTDICTDIVGLQNPAPAYPCVTPTPSPGACLQSGVTWDGAQCVISGPFVNGFSGPIRVRSGNTATLTYTITNPSGSCSITGTNNYDSGPFTPASGVQGSVTTNAITANTRFTLTCTGISRSLNVGITPTFQEQ